MTPNEQEIQNIFRSLRLRTWCNESVKNENTFDISNSIKLLELCFVTSQWSQCDMKT